VPSFAFSVVPKKFRSSLMVNYQFYQFDHQGRTARPPRVALFEDDGAALADARKAVSDITIEVWQGERCVATLLKMPH
jgi:uncharacterized protein YcfL